MDVSENSGTPKSSILIGFSIIKHPFWGTPTFGNTQILVFPQGFGMAWSREAPKRLVVDSTRGVAQPVKSAMRVLARDPWNSRAAGWLASCDVLLLLWLVLLWCYYHHLILWYYNIIIVIDMLLCYVMLLLIMLPIIFSMFVSVTITVGKV